MLERQRVEIKLKLEKDFSPTLARNGRFMRKSVGMDQGQNAFCLITSLVRGMIQCYCIRPAVIVLGLILSLSMHTTQPIIVSYHTDFWWFSSSRFKPTE